MQYIQILDTHCNTYEHEGNIEKGNVIEAYLSFWWVD